MTMTSVETPMYHERNKKQKEDFKPKYWQLSEDFT